MPTVKQVETYENICEGTGQDIDSYFYNLSIAEATEVINEMLEEIYGSDLNEDDCYYYLK